MEEINYQLDVQEQKFDGPLELLLTMIQKNKYDIRDIPIAEVCDQYLAYLEQAQQMDMEIAGEFIVMASELMLIKSKMLLPRPQEDEKDPRAELADALLRYQQAKEAAVKMAELYRIYSGRFTKDTDEISMDNSFVADQQVTSLCAAVRRIIAANESRPKAEKQVFAPMIAKPIVPVEIKIVGILHRMEKKHDTSMEEILQDAVSLPDLIAIFLGILELVKVRKILIFGDNTVNSIHGSDTRFVINDNPVEEPKEPYKRAWEDSDEPIPLSSKAEMHKEQRRIMKELMLAQQTNESPLILGEEKSVSVQKQQVEEMLRENLSEEDEDLLDDLGLDMEEIVRHMAKRAEEFPQEDPTGSPGESDQTENNENTQEPKGTND